jgi:hypothetical protein
VSYKGSWVINTVSGEKRQIVALNESATTLFFDRDWGSTSRANLAAFQILSGESLFPSTGSRDDVVAVRAMTYPVDKQIATKSQLGAPESGRVIGRYDTTFQLEVIEGVTFTDSSKECLDSASVAKLKYST